MEQEKASKGGSPELKFGLKKGILGRHVHIPPSNMSDPPDPLGSHLKLTSFYIVYCIYSNLINAPLKFNATLNITKG